MTTPVYTKTLKKTKDYLKWNLMWDLVSEAFYSLYKRFAQFFS